MPSAEPVREITRGGWVRSVAISPDGGQLAFGSLDNTATVHDIATGAGVREIRRGSCVRSVAFSSDGGRLAVGSGDKTATAVSYTHLTLPTKA